MTNGTGKVAHLQGSKNGFNSQKLYYQSVFDSLKFGIVILDAESLKILEVNRFITDFSGYDPVYFQDKKIHKTGLFDDEKRCAELFAKLAQNGVLEREFLTVTAKDGSKTDFELSASIFSNDENSFIQCQFYPIADQTLSDVDNFRLAAIIENSDDAIISKSFDGAIKSWNKGAEKIFGYTAEEMIGQNIRILIPSELLFEENEIIEKIKENEKLTNYETVRIRKDGEKIHISLTVSPIKNLKGKVIGISKIARDITSRIKAEELHRNIFKELTDH